MLAGKFRLTGEHVEQPKTNLKGYYEVSRVLDNINGN